MYEAFFDMKHTPFTNGIPTDRLYMSPMFEETLGRLEYVAENQLFAVVTSDVGCGKTTAIRKFTSDLDSSRFTYLYISDSQLTPRWLYNGLLEQLGSEPRFYRGDAKRLLHQQLELIRMMQNKRIITIIDESHLMERETLEELRFLLNYRMDSQHPMALVLCGQSELWDKLRKQSYAAIRQRIDIKCEIPQLDRSQTEAYITSHLAYAEGRLDIFTDKAIDEVYKYSAGAPRAINKVCFHSLLSAYQRAKRIIDDHMVKEVINGEMS
jgi:general secretion pathway protein A